MYVFLRKESDFNSLIFYCDYISNKRCANVKLVEICFSCRRVSMCPVNACWYEHRWGVTGDVESLLFCEESFNVSADILYFLRWLVALDNLSFLVDEKLGEVPFDVGRILVVWVCL